MELGARIVVALDCASMATSLALADRLDPTLCRVKVGKEAYVACGPSLIERLRLRGFDVFLDLKFHDIPNTVARACAAAADLDVWMLNVHVLGGVRMLEAARHALERGQRPMLVGVTLLTSMTDTDLHTLGLTGHCRDWVVRLAALAKSVGLDGVVCSAQEARMLREELHDDRFCLVTPGIRPGKSDQDDQERVVTLEEALRLGADYLVIGRPITRASDPGAALLELHTRLTDWRN